MDMNNIPADVASAASKYGINVIEREEDFLATSDKVPGQEFEASTARSALASCLKALGIEEEAPTGINFDVVKQPPLAKPLVVEDAVVAEMAGGEAGKPFSAKVPHRTQVPPAPKTKKLAQFAAAKPVVVEEVPTETESKPQPAPAQVTSLAEARAKRAAKPAAKPATNPKPAPEGAKPAAQKGKPAAPAKPATKSKKAAPGNDNGNGRPRGKRWAIKLIVLRNPAMAADAIIAELGKQNITSTTDSVNSIRLDFLHTLAAAKEAGKLTDKVSKLVPERKAATRNASIVMAAINKIMVEDPTLDVKALGVKLREAVEKKVLDRAGTWISSSRAAIVESIEVMKQSKALR